MSWSSVVPERGHPNTKIGRSAPMVQSIDPPAEHRKPCGRTLTVSRHDTDRAGHARAVVWAVTIGVLGVGQVLLVVILGEVELRRRDDLGRDRAVASLSQPLLIRLERFLRRRL